jgi:hypothetical protein
MHQKYYFRLNILIRQSLESYLFVGWPFNRAAHFGRTKPNCSTISSDGQRMRMKHSLSRPVTLRGNRSQPHIHHRTNRGHAVTESRSLINEDPIDSQELRLVSLLQHRTSGRPRGITASDAAARMRGAPAFHVRLAGRRSLPRSCPVTMSKWSSNQGRTSSRREYCWSRHRCSASSIRWS